MPSKQRLDNNIGYKVEMQSSFSKDKTPLWLNANKHGLSSLDEFNGYVRGAVMRPLSTDSARRYFDEQWRQCELQRASANWNEIEQENYFLTV